MIAVENAEPGADAIMRLIELHRSNVLEVGILQTSASENMRGTKGFPGNYKAFEERLRGLGWDALPRVPTPGVIGLTFWGHFNFVHERHYRELRAALWQAICPHIPSDFRDFAVSRGLPCETEITAPELAKWRNWWCDVHSAYAHIDARRDLFVTANTGDFQRNTAKLERMGLRACTPDDALAEVEG